MAKKKGAKRKAAKKGAKKPFVLDMSDAKEALAVHIRNVEAIVRRHQNSLKKAGGRKTAAGKEVAPKLTQAKRALKAMQAAQSAMESTCECEPAQPCPFMM
jgi:hypothetical protein